MFKTKVKFVKDIIINYKNLQVFFFNLLKWSGILNESQTYGHFIFSVVTSIQTKPVVFLSQWR